MGLHVTSVWRFFEEGRMPLANRACPQLSQFRFQDIMACTNRSPQRCWSLRPCISPHHPTPPENAPKPGSSGTPISAVAWPFDQCKRSPDHTRPCDAPLEEPHTGLLGGVLAPVSLGSQREECAWPQEVMRTPILDVRAGERMKSSRGLSRKVALLAW